MRQAARTDTNQAEITEALRKVGAVVEDTHRLGDGFPDCIVGYRGELYLFEIKYAKGKLRKKQLEFRVKMASVGITVHIVRTPEEGLRIIGAEYEL